MSSFLLIDAVIFFVIAGAFQAWFQSVANEEAKKPFVLSKKGN